MVPGGVRALGRFRMSTEAALALWHGALELRDAREAADAADELGLDAAALQRLVRAHVRRGDDGRGRAEGELQEGRHS